MKQTKKHGSKPDALAKRVESPHFARVVDMVILGERVKFEEVA